MSDYNQRPTGFKRVKLTIFFVFLFFFLMNLVINLNVILHHTVGRPYPPAKILLSTATYMTHFHIAPLEGIAGVNSPIVQPFIYLRDRLYDWGQGFLPEDEAERLIWWDIIYSKQFDRRYMSKIDTLELNEMIEKESNVKLAFDFTDKLYENYIKLSKYKRLEDSEFRKARYLKFIDSFALNYIYYRLRMYNRKAFKDGAPLNFADKNPFLNNDKEIQRIKNILSIYFNFKEYSEKYEKEGIDYIKRNYPIKEDELIVRLATLILGNQINKQKLDCNSKYVRLYKDSRETIINKCLKTRESCSKRKQKELYYILKTDRSVHVENNVKKYCSQ